MFIFECNIVPDWNDRNRENKPIEATELKFYLIIVY